MSDLFISSSCDEDIPAVVEKRKNRGGYDCEFVTPLPESFQAECPICLQILKEPCVISCPCGQKICRECVEQIKNDKKPCPLCNKTEFLFIRDYGLERYLKDQNIFCSKKKLGCQWKGKLRDFEQHLNENSSPEEQLTGCGFVEVECKHGCGEWYERHFVDTHQNEECPQRPYSCEYCKEYDCTFKDVMVHYDKCAKYPVMCPNKCQDDPLWRSKIEDHLNDDCPLIEVSCPFAYAGCEVKLPRKDMPGHTADISIHFPLLASYTRVIEQKQKATESQFEEKLKVMEKQFEERLQIEKKKYEVLVVKLKAVEKEIATIKEEQLQLSLLIVPTSFNVTCNKKREIFLPGFYTHSHGYKMCLCIYTNGNGDGQGTHMSVFICLMRGPFDDHLSWPFRGHVTLCIVNQAGNHSHFVKTISYDDETPERLAARVTGKDKGDNGWGCYKFLAHSDLEYNSANMTQYSKDNIIIIRVVRVKLPQ